MSMPENFAFSSEAFIINNPAFDLYFLPLDFPFPALTTFFFNTKEKVFGNIFFKAENNSFVLTGRDSITAGESTLLIEEYLFAIKIGFIVAAKAELKANSASFF